MQSISFRADKIVAANKMACLRSSVMGTPQFGFGAGRSREPDSNNFLGLRHFAHSEMPIVASLRSVTV
jgi:hypothetical protein